MAPMFHAAGSNSVVDVVWNGAHHVILPGFDPAASLDAIERCGVNS